MNYNNIFSFILIITLPLCGLSQIGSGNNSNGSIYNFSSSYADFELMVIDCHNVEVSVDLSSSINWSFPVELIVQDLDRNVIDYYLTFNNQIKFDEYLSIDNYIISIYTERRTCKYDVELNLVGNVCCIEVDSQVSAPCLSSNHPVHYGSITVSASNGTPPYLYTWSNNTSGPFNNFLAPGLYTLTVTDVNGCTKEEEYFVEDEDIITLNYSQDPVINGKPGKVTVTAYNDYPNFEIKFLYGTPYEETKFATNNGQPVSFHFFDYYQSYFNNNDAFIKVINSSNCDVVEEIDLIFCPSQNNITFTLDSESTGYDDGCDVTPVLKVGNLSSGTPPYIIRAESLEKDNNWSFQDYVDGWILSHHDYYIPNPPSGKIFLSVEDACGYTKTIDHETCRPCRYYSDFNTYKLYEEHNVLHFVGEWLCDDPFWPWDKREIKMNAYSGLNARYYDYSPITVTWPDNQITTITIYQSGGETITGPIKFDILEEHIGSTLIVNVSRGDGCELDLKFPVEVESEVMGAVSYSLNNVSDPKPSDEGFQSSYSCDECFPFVEDFIFGSPPCQNTTAKFFKWEPLDPDRPCGGGGRLWTINNYNGEIKYGWTFIPPNSAIARSDLNSSLNNNSLESIDSDLPAGYRTKCTDGGACFFDTYDVWGFKSEIPVVVEYCVEYEIDEIDTDNDGCLDICDPEPFVFELNCDCNDTNHPPDLNDTDGDGCPNLCDAIPNESGDDQNPDETGWGDCECPPDECPCDEEEVNSNDCARIETINGNSGNCRSTIYCFDDEGNTLDHWTEVNVEPCLVYAFDGNNVKCKGVGGLCDENGNCFIYGVNSTIAAHLQQYSCSDNLPSCGELWRDYCRGNIQPPKGCDASISATNPNEEFFIEFKAEQEETPIVIASSSTSNDSEASIIKISKIENSGFYTKIQEWNGSDGIHGLEDFSYFYGEIGVHYFGDLHAEFGRASKIGESKTTIYFQQEFSGKPIILANLISDNSNMASLVRVSNITETSFDVQVQYDLNASANEIKPEDLGFLAIDKGVGSDGNKVIRVHEVEGGLQSDWIEQDIIGNFNSPPRIISTIQSNNSYDRSSIKLKDITTSKFKLKIQEESNSDSENYHPVESVAYLIIESVDQDCACEEISLVDSIIENPICESNNGTILCVPNGGNAPYTYLWDNNSTDSGLSGLSAGIYSVTVTDNLNCTATMDFELENLNDLNISANGGDEGFFDGKYLTTGTEINWSFIPYVVADQLIITSSVDGQLLNTGKVTSNSQCQCNSQTKCSCSDVFMGDHSNQNVQLNVGSGYVSEPIGDCSNNSNQVQKSNILSGSIIIPNSGFIEIEVIGDVCGVTGTAWYVNVNCDNGVNSPFNVDEIIQEIEKVELSSGNISDNDLILFPNPTENRITISLLDINTHESDLLIIKDINGKSLEVIENLTLRNEINTSEYPPGVYFVEYYSNFKTNITKKFVVIRN